MNHDAVSEPQPRPFGYRVTAVEPEGDPNVPGLWIPARGHEDIRRGIILEMGVSTSAAYTDEWPELAVGDLIWFLATHAPGKIQRRTGEGWQEVWILDIGDIVAYTKDA